jgi:hypothetical protein
MEELVDDVMEDPFEEPEEIIEDPIIQGIFSSFYVLLIITLFIMSSHILFITELRTHLDRLRALMSRTHLEPIDLDWHLPELLHAHYSSDTLREFLDALVFPCIDSMHLISSDYITREYTRRREAASAIVDDMSLLESRLTFSRREALRAQDHVTHGLMVHAQLFAARAAPDTLGYKGQEIESLRTRVGVLTSEVREIQEALDARLGDYMSAQHSIESIVDERRVRTAEARSLLDRIRAFLAPLPSSP